MRKTLSLVLVVAAVAACTSAESSPGMVESTDSAGVTVMFSHGPQWEDGEAWMAAAEPLVTIGVLEGAEEYQLFSVVAAARQSDGDIVVAEGGLGWSNSSGAAQVRLYDRDGGFVRTLGGSGSGPGEFLNPDQVVVTEGDTVAVWDNTTLRTTRFDPAGEFIDVQSVDLPRMARAIDPPLYPGPMSLLPDGSLLVRLVEKAAANVKGRGSSSKVSGVQSSSQGPFRQQSGALLVSVDRSRVDTLMFFGDIEQVLVDAPWGTWNVPPPAAKSTVIAVQPTASKVCIGDQEGPEIACFGPDGSRTVIRWTAEPVALADEEITTWRDTTVELMTAKMSETDVLRALEQVPISEFAPPYSQLTLDRSGNLWVEVGRTDGALESIDHLVFDPQGVLLGHVALPAIEVLEIGDDYVLGLFRDELEVEYLHLYQIVKPSAITEDQ